MDYRFLGIAWPSPVTVDLLLCNMKLLYEAMSTETSIVLWGSTWTLHLKRTLFSSLSAYI